MPINIGFRILPAAPIADSNLLAQFRGAATAHISDCMNRLHSATGLRPFHAAGQLLGTAFTVRVPPGDNLMVHKALLLARPGDVIVVDAGGDGTNAIIGEIMSTYAAKRHLAGIVIDGAIRDSAAIGKSGFPVYAKGVTHRGPFKNGPGEINGPVSIGGMVVSPGDIVVGDEDGLVALSTDVAPIVLKLVRAQAERERAMLAAIEQETSDRSWVDEALRSKGCEF